MIEPYYRDDRVTLYCGRCEDVMASLDMSAVDLVLTDPPYGIGLANHNRGRNGIIDPRISGVDWRIAGDESGTIGQDVLNMLANGGLPVIAFASPRRPWRGEWRQHLVWDKGASVGYGGDHERCWRQSWELIQVARTPVLNGGRDSSVLSFHVTSRDYQHHPAAKPVPLLAYLIQKATQPDALVLDPFAGSGSTLIAAAASGRRAIGIELEERYCAITVQRLRGAL